MAELIIDTNVPLVAKGISDMPQTCVSRCVELLDEILSNKHIVVIDDKYLLIEEYEHKMNQLSEINYANRFLKWLLTNQSNPSRVKQVSITPTGHYEFEEFPQSLKDVQFDNSDRKFVAVAIANNNQAPIVQASDSKWIGWEAALNLEGIGIIFLCKHELTRVYERKQKR